MQKAHSRINWENLPSINTPLGANNLNKMDKALDVIDDRVLSLYGYEGRVQASEKNAKTSETNAKTSETNAKQSELKAKEYMESAFSGTPEGYEQLVEDVRLMDIKTTTDTTLLNSKAGGYKLLSMSGNSVQNGTPTPDAPQIIENVGDCVEMMQGAYWFSDGTYHNSADFVCNKTSIPCKSGDVVKVFDLEASSNVFVMFYNNNGYVSYARKDGVTNTEITVPSDITRFNISINRSGITPSTVGKISLTINGKYVVQIVENGKNFCNGINQSYYLNGNTDKYGCLSGNSGVAIPINGTTYTVSTTITQERYRVGCANSLLSNNTMATCYNGVNKDGTSNSITIDCSGYSYLIVNATDLSALQIEQGEVATEYEPYKETVATVLFNAPLCDTDVMSRTEVVRKRVRVVADGNATVTSVTELTSVLRIAVSISSNPSVSRPNGLCDMLPFLGNYTAESEHFYVMDSLIFLFLNKSRLNSVDITGATEYLTSNPITVEYELAEEVIETLDTDSQIALNSLETFDGVTYINVDSRTQPKSIKGEYGTSKVGARTIKNELRNDTLEIKYNELAVALVATERRV